MLNGSQSAIYWCRFEPDLGVNSKTQVQTTYLYLCVIAQTVLCTNHLLNGYDTVPCQKENWTILTDFSNKRGRQYWNPLTSTHKNLRFAVNVETLWKIIVGQIVPDNVHTHIHKCKMHCKKVSVITSVLSYAARNAKMKYLQSVNISFDIDCCGADYRI